MTRQLRCHLLDRGAHAGDQAAAADRHHHRLEIRQLAHQLETAGRRAECCDPALERMDGVAALGLDDPLHCREQGLDVVDQDDLAAECLAAGDPHRIGGFWHHHLGAHAAAASGPRHRERMVAGADRDHAAPARLRIEPVDVQQRRARLEGARVLEQLELDRDLRIRRQVRADAIGRERCDRRRDDAAGQRLGGGLDLAKARRHVFGSCLQESPPSVRATIDVLGRGAQRQEPGEQEQAAGDGTIDLLRVGPVRHADGRRGRAANPVPAPTAKPMTCAPMSVRSPPKPRKASSMIPAPIGAQRRMPPCQRTARVLQAWPERMPSAANTAVEAPIAVWPAPCRAAFEPVAEGTCQKDQEPAEAGARRVGLPARRRRRRRRGCSADDRARDAGRAP